ncbi:glycoside hydrolase family 5 protein [Stipitochalara longipes BDJ]|nr:glycoside hydrolase family 5 protein [Stipitochalara longipes BDJ]
MVLGSAATALAQVTCKGTFESISAYNFAAGLNLGWNAGNSLDAIPTETSLGQPLLVNSTFTNVKNHGFKGVRLPITWTDHFIVNSSTWDIDPVWLQRVEDVVDMVISNELYTIVNAHHDSWSWLDPTAASANLTLMQEKLYRLWYQVGNKLACKSNLLAFEALNEPSRSSSSDAAFLTSLQETFIRAINDAGGFNSRRVIVLVQYFQRPSANITNPWALTYHYYGPFNDSKTGDFTATAFGRTIWGSTSDKASIDADIAQARGNFTDVPLIIGEFATPPLSTETAARWKLYDFITHTARAYNTSVMLWDAGGSFAVDSPAPWQDPTAIEIIKFAAEGVVNILAESTVDPDAVAQSTSAFLFYKDGDLLKDISLPFVWNGSKGLPLLSITYSTSTSTPNGSKILRQDTEYSIKDANITFLTPFLSTLFAPKSTNGFKANITLHFSTGADLQLQAYQWSAPILSSASSNLNSSIAQNDLAIPITWQGRPQLATVKAQMSNGSYFVDTWTQYLGPLQRGRMTYSNQWDFISTSVILKSAALQAVLTANISTVFTFEFYPRQEDNTVNYTLFI